MIVWLLGDVGDAFYLTVFGELHVKKDGKVVASIKAGRYFGEIALVTDQPRSVCACVRALFDRSCLTELCRRRYARPAVVCCCRSPRTNSRAFSRTTQKRSR